MLKGTCYSINISILVLKQTTAKHNMFQVNSKNTLNKKKLVIKTLNLVFYWNILHFEL